MKRDIIKTMNALSRRHDTWRVFSDFVEMSAVSIANACDKFNKDSEKREARYMEIVKAYDADELKDFAAMLGMLTQALEIEPGDVLGEAFMEMDLGSKWHGQFFTPYSLCKATAAMTADAGIVEKVKQRGFITVSEPSSGGGAMLIAFAEAMRDMKLNYQTQLHVTARDLDIKAVHMSYVQLSLLGIPGVVIHGNTLLNECLSVWRTPMHVMGMWDIKLRRNEAADKPACETVAEAPTKEIKQSEIIQGSLF